MVRMMTYGGTEGANRILQISPGLSPDNRCICKKTAIANHAQENPLRPFDQNRLVPVRKPGMTYGVAKKYHIILLDENGGVLSDAWYEEGVAIPNPGHPAKEGYDPAGWSPSLPATAISDGTYRRQYTLKTYTITFIGKDGQTLPNSGTYTHGQSITAPDPQTPAGWTFLGWNPSVPSTATQNGTYKGQYSQNADIQPAEDKPSDDDGNVWPYVAFTMDNLGQTYNSSKNTPTTSISQWQPVGGGWWSGPFDGDSSDPYGEDNGIAPTSNYKIGSVKVLEGCTYIEGDSCLYEYADANDEDLAPSDPSQYQGERWLLTEWTSPNGKFHIKSDNPDWIKFLVCRTSEHYYDPDTGDTYYAPFEIQYYVGHNESNSARRGTITVTTDGGICNYNWNSKKQKGRPYITNAKVYFYQLGLNEAGN